MSTSNVILVRFQTKRQVISRVSSLSAYGYEVRNVGLDGFAVWNGDDLVFTASRYRNDQYFCRASAAYMAPDDDLSAVV